MPGYQRFGGSRAAAGTSTPTVANRTPDGYDPSRNNFLAAVSDPEQLNSQNAIPSGTVIMFAIPLDTAITVSTFWYSVSTAANTPVAGQNFVGVYGNRTGNTINLLGLSGDQSTNFTGANVNRSAALTVQAGQSLTLPAGSTVWTAFLFSGNTGPTLLRIGSQSIAGNVNLAAPNLRSMNSGTGLTAMPATIDLTTTTLTSPYWAALS
jgi:hypothetical protein